MYYLRWPREVNKSSTRRRRTMSTWRVTQRFQCSSLSTMASHRIFDILDIINLLVDSFSTPLPVSLRIFSEPDPRSEVAITEEKTNRAALASLAATCSLFLHPARKRLWHNLPQRGMIHITHLFSEVVQGNPVSFSPSIAPSFALT